MKSHTTSLNFFPVSLTYCLENVREGSTHSDVDTDIVMLFLVSSEGLHCEDRPTTAWIDLVSITALVMPPARLVDRRSINTPPNKTERPLIPHAR